MSAKNISQKGLDFIKKEEKFMPNVYFDAVGVRTIGYGHVIKSFENFEGKTLTEAEATELMKQDLKPKINTILSKVNRPLKQNELDALASLVFNIGSSAFRDSTVLRRINNGESKERISEAWKWWNKGTVQGVKVTLKGLVNRRAEEVELFFSEGGGVLGLDYEPTKKKILKISAAVIGLILLFFIAKRIIKKK